LIDPASGEIVEKIPVGDGPAALATAGGTLWVANADGQSVTRVDERTRRVTATIAAGGHPTQIVADAKGAWVARADRRLVRIDGQFNRLTDDGVAFDGTALIRGGSWLWDVVDFVELERRDAATARRERTQILDHGGQALAWGGDALWIGGREASISSLDPRRGIVGDAVRLLGPPVAVASGKAGVWVVTRVRGESRLELLDVASLAVTDKGRVGSNASAVVEARGAAWVANTSDGTVTSVDIDGTTRTIEIGATPTALAADGAGVWVAAS
jgi:YVTN family beta-propeller protein